MKQLSEKEREEYGQELDSFLKEEKLHQVKDLFSPLLDRDVAALICSLDGDQRLKALRLLPPKQVANLICEYTADLFESSEHLLRSYIKELETDDLATLISSLDRSVIPFVLNHLNRQKQKEVKALLSFPEESIARVMTPNFISLQESWTIEQALAHIRKVGNEVESLDRLYVVDNNYHLLDVLSLKIILLSEPQKKINEIMDYNFISLNAYKDQEEAVIIIKRHDLSALPIVDDEQKLLGVVTFDDIADIEELETSEDIEKLGGMEALGERYSSVGLLKLFRKRVLWLLVLFGGGIFTIFAMGAFHEKINDYAILALFVPLIISSGGNAGTQTASLMIRALAIGDVELKDWLFVVLREFLNGILMGISLGIFGFITAYCISHFIHPNIQGDLSTVSISFTIGGAIMAVVLWGSLVGSLLPFLFGRLGMDPATSSTPTVSVLVDVIGLVLYFFLADLILGI